jgi:hypothetical protein
LINFQYAVLFNPVLFFFNIQAKNLSLTRQRACDDSKKAYAAELQKTNMAQHEHYHSLMPKVFDVSTSFCFVCIACCPAFS